MSTVFVTGTDTGVGKTLVAAALMCSLAERGLRVAGMKPVASGARRGTHGLINEDAEALMRFATVAANYDEVNPYCFAPAIAPHLAAAEAGVVIDVDAIGRCAAALAARADWLVVEGVGGWRVPLAPGLDVADLAAMLGFPVVLVVALRLGCLNHARLSATAIRRRGCRLAGWVANEIDSGMTRREENVATLRAELDAPCLGEIPSIAGADPREAAVHLSLEALLGHFARAERRDYPGRCHCGNVELAFTTSTPPGAWSLRACQCRFCRAHGAVTTSDPQGGVSFAVHDAGKLLRYRFGTRSAEFLLCRGCGSYVAAILEVQGERYATVNVNILAIGSELDQLPSPVSYEFENSEERLKRRRLRWTPVTQVPEAR